MDIVLGVSMTPTTVRMVLVEGEKADGVTVDHDVFDIKGADGSATSSPADQVAAAVLGTQESAATSGHHLKSIGVTWTHHSDAAALRDTLAARGIEDVMLVSATHAAASLAQAVGRAIGYDTTALLFIEKDTATLSVVQTEDGSVVKVLSRDLHDSDAMAVFTEMAKSVESAQAPPQGLFIVGSGVDAAAVKAHLENLVALPVSAPDEPELALARGAALASAHAPEMEASTAGLAYSQDRDGTTAASAYPELAGAVTQMAGVATQMAPARTDEAYSDLLAYSDEIPEPDPEPSYEEESHKPFLLVGSALTSIFVVGVVALVISLAVSIRPTVDQRPSPGETPVIPSQVAPAPAQELAPAAPAPAPAPAAPPPETIKAPVPVVQQAPAQAPRTVFVEQPAAPAPAAALAPAPAAPAPVPAAPVPVPAAPVVPPIYNPPVYNPPVYAPQRPPAWVPPWRNQPQRPAWQPPWSPPQQDPPQQVPYDPPQQSPQYPGGGGSSGYPGSSDYPGSSGSGSGSSQYPGSSGYPGSGSGDYGGGGSGSRGGGPSICVFGICSGGH
ncbi:MAG: hypothetical protein QOC76_3300 [Mycobacterium sp.]|nr:hypothetical protein [Mycobacterium sp.]